MMHIHTTLQLPGRPDLLIERDDDTVTVTRTITGDVVSTHTMGATTITGASPVLTADERRAVHALLVRAEAAAATGLS